MTLDQVYRKHLRRTSTRVSPALLLEQPADHQYLHDVIHDPDRIVRDTGGGTEQGDPLPGRETGRDDLRGKRLERGHCPIAS